MSVNKKMHPRNIFKTPPSFSELGAKYPEFYRHLKVGLQGKISLNYNDTEALRALSKVLLFHYFGIQIDIPQDTLVPTIPLRLNYVLWLQDLAEFMKVADKDIHVIDIGTGASCVYGLLMSKLRQWKVLALESNENSLEVAKKNVEANQLASYISVKKPDVSKILLGSLTQDMDYTFTMCNPPFFDDNECLEENITKRKPPKNAFTGKPNELSFPGGEVAFIKQIITESQMLNTRVAVYTTMVGHKKNLKPIKQFLNEAKIFSYTQTEFCQGNTTRWAIAWTFKENIDLRQFVSQTSDKTGSKAQSFEQITKKYTDINELLIKLEDTLKELKMAYDIYKVNKILVELKVSAFENTWANARRKRRKEARRNTKIALISSVLTAFNALGERLENILNTNPDHKIETSESEIHEMVTTVRNDLEKLKEIEKVAQETDEDSDIIEKLWLSSDSFMNVINRNNKIQLSEDFKSLISELKSMKLEYMAKSKLNNDKNSKDSNLEPACKKIKLEGNEEAILKSKDDEDAAPKKISSMQCIEAFTSEKEETDSKNQFQNLNSDSSFDLDNVLDDRSNDKCNKSKEKNLKMKNEEIISQKSESHSEIVVSNSKIGSNCSIIDFNIFLHQLPIEDGIKMILVKTKSDDPNLLCQIYNFVKNKLQLS